MGRVVEAGDTDLRVGQMYTREEIKEANARAEAEGKEPCKAKKPKPAMMTSGDIHLVINTPTASGSETDEGRIRSTAVRLSIPMITTATAARAAVDAIAALRAGDWSVRPLQEYAAAAHSGKVEPVPAG